MTVTGNLRLASYNIRKCIGLDRRRDPGRILQVLNGIDADVVVLQEADRRLGARPAALPHAMIETETDFIPVAFDDGASLGFHGNAILKRRGLATGQPMQIALPGTEPRGAVSIDIGDALRVVGVHLGLLRSDRRRQLAAIRAEIGDDMPTAILGDFNEWKALGCMAALESDYLVHTPGRSFHAARPIAALDRVALSHGLELRDAGVVTQRPARIASDHLPIWADVAGISTARRAVAD